MADGTAVESVVVLLFIWPTRSLEVAELLGVVADELLWSVELGVLLMEPVALLFPEVPVVLVLPTWLWSEGVVVVVVVVV